MSEVNTQTLAMLIVEDDVDQATELAEYIETHGFDVDTAHNGDQFKQAFDNKTYDIIIMDLNVPGGDGLRFTQYARQTSDVPIIMLTSRSDVVDRVVGLEIGADDYVTKPFNMRELMARVNAATRRQKAKADEASKRTGPANGSDVQGTFAFDTWRFDQRRFVLMDDAGETHTLTSAESALLRTFCLEPGRVLSRDHLMDDVFGRDWDGNDRAIDNLVLRVRTKLALAGPDYNPVKSIRGVGYSFTPDVRTVAD